MATLSSPTLQRLMTNVRNMLNQPDRNNSFWSDDELIEYINEGIRLYFVEITHGNEGQFSTVSNLNVVSNVETVALPTDCFEIRALYKKRSDGFDHVIYDNTLNVDYSTQGGTDGNTYSPTYFFRGNDIVLRPIPNFSETASLRLEYIQFPETLINGGDVLTSQVSPVFKQLIEMYSVYKAKIKESLVNGVNVHQIAKENLAEIYSQFQDATAMRSRNSTYVQPFEP